MASPWDDVREESTDERGPRPSPLPWMLLTVSILMTVGVLWASRQRLDEERARTAAALRANDELKARLKSTEAELARFKMAPAPSEQE